MLFSKRTHSNQELIDGIKNSDHQTLKFIIKRIFPEVHQLLAAKGCGQEEARDITSKALESIFLKLQKEELTLEKASFKTYFSQVCLFQWYKIVRRNKIHEKVTKTFPEVSIENTNLEEDALRYDRYRLFEEKLQEMGEKCRKILIWAFQKNWSIKQIAEKLQIKEGTIRKRKFDCKAKLVKSIRLDKRYDELTYGFQ